MTEMNTEATVEVAAVEPTSELTVEQASSDAVQNADTAEVKATTESETVAEPSVDEISEILNKIFLDMEAEVTPEPKTFGPKVTETIHDSEAKAMLENVKKELELRNSEISKKETDYTEVSQKNQELIAELESIRTEKAQTEAEIQKQKADIETLEEFYKVLSTVPVLGELVNVVAEKGANAVNIPKYLKDLQESRIMAQGTEPVTREAMVPEKKSTTSTFEDAILRRNTR